MVLARREIAIAAVGRNSVRHAPTAVTTVGGIAAVRGGSVLGMMRLLLVGAIIRLPGGGRVAEVVFIHACTARSVLHAVVVVWNVSLDAFLRFCPEGGGPSEPVTSAHAFMI